VHQTVDRGHGRIEHRRVHTAPMPAGTWFPHAKQVVVIQRHTTDLAGGHPRTEVAYAITSLDPARADPARLGVLARGQWEIENRAHWVRDVGFDEDRSQVRTGHGPQVMATLRVTLRSACCGWAGMTISPAGCAGRVAIGPAPARSSCSASETKNRCEDLGLLGYQPKARSQTRAKTPSPSSSARGRRST
jgi:hypothetical protein